MTGGTIDLRAEWAAATSVALLGTDRRAPAVPDGRVGDLLADARLCGRAIDPAEQLAVVTAALAAVRRAGVTPGPALQADVAPLDDHRPMLSVAAAARWREIVRDWPVLEDEFLLRTVEVGWRLPPDVLVAMLRRHRTDSARRALALVAGGPSAGWIVARFPALAATSSRGPRGTRVAVPTALPELALPAPLAPLLHECDVAGFDGVLDDLRHGRVGAAHRAVLVNLCARARPGVLVALADALATVAPVSPSTSPSAGLAVALADLCRTRAAMLEELA